MKKANNIMGKMDYFSSVDKLANDFMPKQKSPLSVGSYDYIGAFSPPVKKKYNPYKQEMSFLPEKKRFDPYTNTWGRQVQQMLHTGPAQSKELNKKQVTELIHELKEKKMRTKKMAEDVREISSLSKKYMNAPWSAVPAKYRQKYARMDFDGDGIINMKDCYPFDYDRQISIFGIYLGGPSNASVAKAATSVVKAVVPTPVLNVVAPVAKAVAAPVMTVAKAVNTAVTPVATTAAKTVTSAVNTAKSTATNIAKSITPTGSFISGFGSAMSIPASAPVVNITVPKNATVSDVVWAGNVAAAVAQAATQPNTPAGTVAGNTAIAGVIKAAKDAGAQVIVGTTPINEITNVGGVSTSKPTSDGGSSPGRIYFPGETSKGPDTTPVDPVTPVTPYDPLVPQTYGMNLMGDIENADAKWKMYQDILDGKLNDPALKARLELELGPYLAIYNSKIAQYNKLYEKQFALVDALARRKEKQMALVGGVNLVNQAPFRRAQEILSIKADRYKTIRDEMKELQVAEYNKTKLAKETALTREAESEATKETAARKGEYTSTGIVGTGSYTSYVPFSKLSAAEQVAQGKAAQTNVPGKINFPGSPIGGTTTSFDLNKTRNMAMA